MSDFFACAAAVAAVLLLCSCAENQDTFSESFFALDTAVTVTSDREVPAFIKSVTLDADKSFSKVCGQYDVLTETDAERVNFCIDFAKRLNSEYNGKLDLYCGRLTALWGISGDDPKEPGESEIKNALEAAERPAAAAGGSYPDLDLGAAAKGYAADMVYKALCDENTSGYVIFSAESSILLYGEKDGGFKIGVRSPEGDGSTIGSFTVPCGFVSTSGGYERYFEENGVRYSHILDTETGYPIETDLTSVTVYCGTMENGGLMSDLLSTLIYCGGSERLADFTETEGIGFIAADKNKQIYVSGLDFQPQEGSGYICRNIKEQTSPI